MTHTSVSQHTLLVNTTHRHAHSHERAHKAQCKHAHMASQARASGFASTHIFQHTLAIVLTLVLTLAATRLSAQGHVCYAAIINGDTLPAATLPELTVTESWSLLTEYEIRHNQKLIRNIKKMLPYAVEGKRRLDQLEHDCVGLSPKQRTALIKATEKKLLDDYTEELEKCTISQGKVLLKLIDLETGSSSYMIVRELRGKLRASFYQTFARVFGFNMKARFDPKHNKEDDLIERIVKSVKAGKL